MPLDKIMPNYTVDDYYRWWVVHLWVELTFELFAAGVLAFLTVALGLVSRQTAERVMLFELGLIMMSGTLGVGHHYWWQGLDEYCVITSYSIHYTKLYDSIHIIERKRQIMKIKK